MQTFAADVSFGQPQISWEGAPLVRLRQLEAGALGAQCR